NAEDNISWIDCSGISNSQEILEKIKTILEHIPVVIFHTLVCLPVQVGIYLLVANLNQRNGTLLIRRTDIEEYKRNDYQEEKDVEILGPFLHEF
ncbi:hypothetical protein MBAV_003647, partial [Candidatus Magnetobacterium bavaricum]